MIKLEPADMDLLVLICTNPDHPSIFNLLSRLSDAARAIAVLVLKEQLGPEKAKVLPALPSRITASSARNAEIKAAAVEFAKMAAGRRREAELRLQRHRVPEYA